ncbi:MAG: beta-galactosidase [Opitutus sp.]
MKLANGFRAIVALLAISGVARWGVVAMHAAPSPTDSRLSRSIDELMPVGAYYYPEHWSREEWSRDLKRMASLGFRFTHMAEFAWSNLEPVEGKFDFEWLDWCVAEAGKHGLKVVLCTPSACPPVWLTTKHPEILNVNDQGIRSATSGNRLQANQAHPIYRRYIAHIVTEMAKRYGNDARVWGWQIDNEPHVGTIFDYSEFAQSDFRAWLRQKFRSDITQLNTNWGNAFWSSRYGSWDEIRIPNEKESSSNPHALLDFRRYTADALASSIRFQAELLRQHVATTQWITTNFAYYKFLPPVDLFRSRGDLDFASHTMYLLSTFLNQAEGPLAVRLGSGLELAFSSELARSIQGETGIMELQPGQINWGSYNAQPLPGAVRMWMWHSFGLGDRFICTYRFRQPRFGSEQTHKGILETDGVTVSRGGLEYVRTIAELRDLGRDLPRGNKPSADVASRRTAFLWKQDNLWEMQASPHTKSWDTWQHTYAYYSALKRMGAAVTFVSEQEPLDPQTWPFVVAPAYSMTDEAVVSKWREYVTRGGHLILTCRTAQKDNRGHFHPTRLQEPIWDLIGAKIQDNDQLPPSATATVQAAGQSHVWNAWAELLQLFTGTESLANYADQFYAGTSAAVTRSLGQGTVTYVGVWTTTGELEHHLLKTVYQRAGARILDLPAYVFVEWRDGLAVAVNYSSQSYELPIPTSAKLRLGTRELKPGEVTVWVD